MESTEEILNRLESTLASIETGEHSAEPVPGCPRRCILLCGGLRSTRQPEQRTGGGAPPGLEQFDREIRRTVPARTNHPRRAHRHRENLPACQVAEYVAGGGRLSFILPAWKCRRGGTGYPYGVRSGERFRRKRSALGDISDSDIAALTAAA